MTTRQLIYAVLNILRGGHISDDEPLSDRFILSLVNAARATLIRQQVDKGQTISDNHIQPINCLDVVQVDSVLNINTPGNCKIIRSSLRIPSPIETKEKDLITNISSPEIGVIPFDYISYARLPYATFGRFSNRAKVAVRDSYLYIINSPFIKQVTLEGIWYDPTEVCNYTSCSGDPCFTWDDPYPISGHLENAVIDIVLSKLRNPNMPSDQINDASGTVQSSIEPRK